MDELVPRHRARFPVAVSWLDDGALPLPEGGVLLVMLRPEGARDALEIETSLSAGERERRDRIQHPRAYAEFHAGRRLIRTVLGGLMGIAPAEVVLIESERGALSLGTSHDSPLRFNISHTDGLVVLAVANTDVGVDVEWLDRTGWSPPRAPAPDAASR